MLENTQCQKALDCLKKGELVILPTETVYGIAADAQNEEAVKKIFKAKNRPDFNPLISHYAEVSEIDKDVVLDSRARKLLEKFSPGPLTLVLNKKENSRISDLVSSGLKTAAVRIPEKELSLELLKSFAAPVAAPSANLSTELSPTQIEHLNPKLLDQVSLVLDQGPCEHGIESTIVDLSTDKVIVLRFGSITSQEIEETLGEKVFLKDDSGEVKAPGSLLKHYAPKTKLRLNSKEALSENDALLAFGEPGSNTQAFQKVINLSPKADLAEAARNLFASLHSLDKEAFQSIAVMPIPEQGLGLAINDKLIKAAS